LPSGSTAFSSERIAMTVRNHESRTFGMLRLLPLVLAVSFAAALLPASGAGAGSTNAITVSGALKGTLKVVPRVTCSGLNSGQETLSWNSAKLSPKKAQAWSIIFNKVTRPGTFKLVPSTILHTKLNVVLMGGIAYAWVSSAGKLTVGKGGMTGSINATLGLHEGTATGTVYLKGSWKCT
jgi:hypothetical protein